MDQVTCCVQPGDRTTTLQLICVCISCNPKIKLNRETLTEGLRVHLTSDIYRSVLLPPATNFHRRLSVILFTGGGGAGGMHGRGGMCGKGGCAWQGDVHGMHAPPGRYYDIWSLSGRYASYWNAFLYYNLHFKRSQLALTREVCNILLNL